jgi:hypothetical protein
VSETIGSSTVGPLCGIYQELSDREQSLLRRSNGCTRLQWTLHFLDTAFWTHQIRVRHAVCCADCLAGSDARSAA